MSAPGEIARAHRPTLTALVSGGSDTESDSARSDPGSVATPVHEETGVPIGPHVGAGTVALFHRGGAAASARAMFSVRAPDPPPPQRPQVHPRKVLFVGAPGTGKSSAINAFRQLTSPSCRWERAAVGRVGRRSVGSVRYFFNTTNTDRLATWCLVDTPGHLFQDFSSADTRDSRLLAALLRGVDDGIAVAGRSSCDIETIEESAASGNLAPEAVIVTLRAIDLVREERSWMYFSKRVLDTASASPAVDNIANVVEFIHHERCIIPHVLVTHMDAFSNPVAARMRIEQLLHDVCPAANQHYVSLVPEQRGAVSRVQHRVDVPVLRGPATSHAGVGPGSTSPSMPGGLVLDGPSRSTLSTLHQSLVADISAARERCDPRMVLRDRIAC